MAIISAEDAAFNAGNFNFDSVLTDEEKAQANPSYQKRLNLEERTARKKDRMAAKAGTAGQDSDITLGAKSLWNNVNDLWGGKDFTANIDGNEVGMSNKIFEDSDTTMGQSQLNRQMLIDQYNSAEDDPNAKHKVYQLRLLDGYDEQGNALYTYKTGIAATSAAARYKDQYIKDGYEIMSEKGFAGAEDWENKWHGNKANIADRTYGYGKNTAGDKIKDAAQIDAGYTEVYNQQFFDQGVTGEQIAQNQVTSQQLSDANDAAYNGGQYSVIDAAQAGFAKAGVSSADFILDVLTPGNNDWLDNAKKQETIDKFVGFDRTKANKAIGEATGYWNQGNYTAAVGEVLKNPEITAESLGMMAEMLVGFGKFTKLGKSIDTYKNVIARADKAGDVATATKAKARLAREISQGQRLQDKVLRNAGFLTVVGEQANNSLEERKINNGGVEPTFGEIIGVTAEKVLELGLDRIAFGKITGLDGGTRMLKDAFGASSMSGKKKILGKIAETAAGLSAAGAAEAAQEYTQTWGQILSEQLGTLKNGGDFASIISNEENIHEALGATLAGAAGGVHMRAPVDAVQGVVGAVGSYDSRLDNTRTSYGNSAIDRIGEETNADFFTSFTDSAAKAAASDAVMTYAIGMLDDPAAFAQSPGFKNGTYGSVNDLIENSIDKIATINKLDGNEQAKGYIAAGVMSRINKAAIANQRNSGVPVDWASVEAQYENIVSNLKGFDKDIALDQVVKLHRDRIAELMPTTTDTMTGNKLQLTPEQQADVDEAKAIVQRMGSFFDGSEGGPVDPEAQDVMKAAQAMFESSISKYGEGKTSDEVRNEIFETGFDIGMFTKKSMKTHTADILSDAAMGSASPTNLDELETFVKSRNTGKVRETYFDEGTQKFATYNDAQIKRHVTDIIEDNNKMQAIIEQNIIAKLKGVEGQEDVVTRLEGMATTLAEQTAELDAILADTDKFNAFKDDTWNSYEETEDATVYDVDGNPVEVDDQQTEPQTGPTDLARTPEETAAYIEGESFGEAVFNQVRPVNKLQEEYAELKAEFAEESLEVAAAFEEGFKSKTTELSEKAAAEVETIIEPEATVEEEVVVEPEPEVEQPVPEGVSVIEFDMPTEPEAVVEEEPVPEGVSVIELDETTDTEVEQPLPEGVSVIEFDMPTEAEPEPVIKVTPPLIETPLNTDANKLMQLQRDMGAVNIFGRAFSKVLAKFLKGDPLTDKQMKTFTENVAQRIDKYNLNAAEDIINEQNMMTLATTAKEILTDDGKALFDEVINDCK